MMFVFLKHVDGKRHMMSYREIELFMFDDVL